MTFDEVKEKLKTFSFVEISTTIKVDVFVDNTYYINTSFKDTIFVNKHSSSKPDAWEKTWHFDFHMSEEDLLLLMEDLEYQFLKDKFLKKLNDTYTIL